MEVLNLQGAENSLLCWPSLSQFDDLILGGFGEFDQSKQVSQLAEASNEDWYMDIEVDIKAPIASSPKGGPSPHTSLLDCSEQPVRTETSGSDISRGSQSYPYLSYESSAESSSSKPWYSMDCSDLACVLDAAFVGGLSTSIPSCQLLEGSQEDYSVYNEDMILTEPDRILSDDADIFVGEPMRKGDDPTAVTASSHLQYSDAMTIEDSNKLHRVQQDENYGNGNATKGGTKNSGDQGFEDDFFGKRQAYLGESSSSDTVHLSPLPFSSRFPFKCEPSEGFSFQAAGRKLPICQVNKEPTSSTWLSSIERACPDLGFGKQCSKASVTTVVDTLNRSQGWHSTKKRPLMSEPSSKQRKALDGLKSPCSSEMTEGLVVPYKTPRKAGSVQENDKVNQAQVNRARRRAASHRRAEIRARNKLSLHDLNQKSSQLSQDTACCTVQPSFPLYTPSPLLHSSASVQTTSPLPMSHSTITPFNSASIPSFRPSIEEAQSSWTTQPKQCMQTMPTEVSHTLPLSGSSHPISPLPLQQPYPVSLSHTHPISAILCQEQQLNPGPQLFSHSHDGQPCTVTEERETPQSRNVLSTTIVDHDLHQYYSLQEPVQAAPHASSQPRVLPCSSSRETIPKSSESKDFVEATVVQQFGTIIDKMNMQTRLMIRDSLYRLAKSAKERNVETECSTPGGNLNFSSEPFGLLSKQQCRRGEIHPHLFSHLNQVRNAGLAERTYMELSTRRRRHSEDGIAETKTNHVDRWIANLLFCKQTAVSESNMHHNQLLAI